MLHGSPLTQGRGLKQLLLLQNAATAVAPHAGAWIETFDKDDKPTGSCVAPHAGAWIETSVSPTHVRCAESPLTQGRGLKRDHRAL